MALEFTKLSEVENIETPVAEATVIVEDNGSIKRTPMKNISGDKVLGEDGKLLNEVFPEGYPYEEKIVNRTAIVEETVLTSTTNGSQLVYFNASVTQMIETGKTYEITIDGETYSVECGETFVPDQMVPSIESDIFSITRYDANTVTVAVNTTEPADVSVSISFSLYEVEEQTTIAPIADKFLPDNIARTEDIPEPTVNVLNENGIIKQEHLPSGYGYKNAEILFSGIVSVGYYNTPLPETSAEDIINGETYRLKGIINDEECVGEGVASSDQVSISLNGYQFIFIKNDDGGISVSNEFSEKEYELILERVVVSYMDESYLRKINFNLFESEFYYDGKTDSYSRQVFVDIDFKMSPLVSLLEKGAQVYVSVSKVVDYEYQGLEYGYGKLNGNYTPDGDGGEIFNASSNIGKLKFSFNQATAGEDKLKMTLLSEENLDIQQDDLIYVIINVVNMDLREGVRIIAEGLVAGAMLPQE